MLNGIVIPVALALVAIFGIGVVIAIRSRRSRGSNRRFSSIQRASAARRWCWMAAPSSCRSFTLSPG